LKGVRATDQQTRRSLCSGREREVEHVEARGAATEWTNTTSGGQTGRGRPLSGLAWGHSSRHSRRDDATTADASQRRRVKDADNVALGDDQKTIGAARQTARAQRACSQHGGHVAMRCQLRARSRLEGARSESATKEKQTFSAALIVRIRIIGCIHDDKGALIC
jgi:hypothetical protein